MTHPSPTDPPPPDRAQTPRPSPSAGSGQAAARRFSSLSQADFVPDPDAVFRLYLELRDYVGWDADDERRLKELRPLLEPAFPALADDFYAVIVRHPDAARVITGGAAQIERLKQTLIRWLTDVFTGPYDATFVMQRFRVGRRHVEIGLEQFYTNVALSRVRGQLQQELLRRWTGSLEEAQRAADTLNRMLDLDLALIEFAYQSEFAAREERNGRLVTLGKISAGIAHELRNPLNAIRTSAWYLLNATGVPPDKAREHLERIERQVLISDRTITALSRFAKMPVPTLRPVSPNELIEQTLAANPVPPSVDVAKHCPEHAPPILGDRDQLCIVLGNLVRNACDAMPQGGRLELRGTVSDGEIAASTERRFSLSVTDSGTGIDPSSLPYVMEPLFTTKARGLGLGLALARAIIQKHSGELTVVSCPGQGTTFTMILHLADVESAANSG